MDDQAARAIILQAGARVLGRPPTWREAQAMQAVAWLESSYGRGWARPHPACADCKNWGGVQAKPGEAGCDAYDTYPDGRQYNQPFKVYASDLEGAEDLVRQMIVHRHGLSMVLQNPAISWQAVASAMFYSHYFGSQCPKAIATYGDEAKQSFGFPGHPPATTEGGKACEAECIQHYADTLKSIGDRIAAAVDESQIPRLGDVPGMRPSSSPSGAGAQGNTARTAYRGGGEAFMLLPLALGGILIALRRKQ